MTTLGALLRPLLAPPPLHEGEKPWLRYSVDVLSLSLAAGLVLALVDNAMTGRQNAVWLLTIQLVIVGVVLWMNRSRPPRRAARLLALSLPLLATGLLIGGDFGLHDVGVLVFPACLIVAGLLLERRTLALLTVETIACIAIILVAEARGLVGQRAADPYLLQDFVDATIILVVTAIGVGLVAGQMRAALVQAKQSAAALKVANDALEERSERLRTSEARYRGLVDLAVDAILVGDSEGHIVEANRQATVLTGYEKDELIGWRVDQLFAPGELRREPLRPDLVGKGQAVVRERLVTRKDGSTVPVEMCSGRMPDGTYQSIVRDLSERTRAEDERRGLEARLHQGKRMEAIGRLAGGVAHEYNNLLSAITGNLALALRHTPPTDRSHRWLKEVDTAAWRAADITRQLLAFARQQDVEPKTLDLRELLETLYPKLESTVGEPVTLETRLPDGPCPVRADRQAIERALVNLAANGRDAMPNGGTLTVELGNATAEDVGRAHPEAPRVPHAVLSVTDTGVGMSDDVRSRLFEPFFTTKLSGSSAGLSLALVYTVVEQHHGWIDIETAPGHGTTFRVHLPQADAAPAAEA